MNLKQQCEALRAGLLDQAYILILSILKCRKFKMLPALYFGLCCLHTALTPVRCYCLLFSAAVTYLHRERFSVGICQNCTGHLLPSSHT